jgi:hypothetical protein
MRKRFPIGDVISAVGIHREESSARVRMPVRRLDERTVRKLGMGHAWNPILDWPKARVVDYVRIPRQSPARGLHDVPDVQGVVCVCIMRSEHHFSLTTTLPFARPAST